MIREIVVEFKTGENTNAKRILSAIQAEIYDIAFETSIGIEHELPKFPGKLVINIFDENEELMEVIET